MNRPHPQSRLLQSDVTVTMSSGRTMLIGDRMGRKIGQITGREPCGTCKKIEAAVNAVDKGVRKLIRA